MLILVDDPSVAAHLVAALRAHQRRCQRDAVPLPAPLVELVQNLASGGQPRPGVGPTMSTSDGDGMDLALDYRTVADRLHISDRQVRRLVADGRLKAVRIGGARRVRTADLTAFVEQLDEIDHEEAA